MTAIERTEAQLLLRRIVRDARLRHLLAAAIGAGFLALFAAVHASWSPMHRWNRAFGDVSLMLVALSVGIGPLSRFVRPVVRVLPLRRELGIHGCLYAIVHTAIILVGWVEWDLMRLFGFEWHPQIREYVMFQHGFALANAVGLAALGLVILLAATSSDLAVGLLGASGWKFIQMGVLPLWWLTVAHVGYFIFIHFMSFHRATPEPNPLQMWFVALVLLVLSLRSAAYVQTVRLRAQAHMAHAGSKNAPV